MPQTDRYKPRDLDIEFLFAERFAHFPYPDHYSLTCITDGTLRGELNGRQVLCAAPCFLCLSGEDRATLSPSGTFSAQSFVFHPDFLRTAPLPNTLEYRKLDPELRIDASIFLRESTGTGLFPMDREVFSKLRDWFFLLGTEVYAQSDSLWVCRIKSYLIRIMEMLQSLSRERGDDPVDAALDYIFCHYFDPITLDDLTRQAHTNRVTLNQRFHERCSCTAMEYLTRYRMRIAEEELLHTGMTLADISQSVGYSYDTYFIRQFTKRKDMSPTQFRQSARKFSEMA